MALSRLREFRESVIYPILYNYYDPDNRIRNQTSEMLVVTSNASQGISKIYTNLNTLTVFAATNSREKSAEKFDALKSLHPKLCLGWQARDGQRKDSDHNLMHQTRSDFSIRHKHIIKGRAATEEMTPLDIICILNLIKQNEQSNSLCLDGKTDCMLADADEVRINAEYAKTLTLENRTEIRQEKLALERKVEAAFLELEQCYLSGMKGFALAYITTLLEKYLKPYLITQNIHPNQATWAIEIAKSSLNVLFASTWVDVGLEFIMRQLLGKH